MTVKASNGYSVGGVPAVFVDSRICFSIAYFATEADAEKAGEGVTRAGRTYNGGLFNGMPCGRDTSWDVTKDGVKYFACTF